MERSIPGTIPVEGREFMYVEALLTEDFSTFVDRFDELGSSVLMPKSGGAIEEKARILLHDDLCLLALSYKGDIGGWRNRFIACCEPKGRRWGIAKDGILALSDGTQIQLSRDNVVFDR